MKTITLYLPEGRELYLVVERDVRQRSAGGAALQRAGDRLCDEEWR
jgi:hypothetical protein